MDFRFRNELLLLGLHRRVRWQLQIGGRGDVGGKLPLITRFLTKERGFIPFIGLWLKQRKSISKIDLLNEESRA